MKDGTRTGSFPPPSPGLRSRDRDHDGARLLACLGFALVASGTAQDGNPAAEPPALFFADFAEARAGEVPEDFFVMAGAWRLAESQGRVALELAPRPLLNGHLQLGESLRQEGACLRATVELAREGRSHSQAEIGLHGVSGYRLRLHRAGRRLELLKAGLVVAEADISDPAPDRWILELEVVHSETNETGYPDIDHREDRSVEPAWTIRASAWPFTANRPRHPLILHHAPPERLSGRASLRATPFAGLPIRFLEVLLVAAPGDRG